VLVAVVVLPGPASMIERVPAAIVAFAGARGLLVCALQTRAWTRPLVERAMGLSLRRLLVFTAAVVLVTFQANDAETAWVPLAAAAVILCGYPLAFGLRAAFPPS
jgi:hypothetical protein